MAAKNLPVGEAVEIVRAGAIDMPDERVALTQAHGRVLAHAIRATRDQPPFRASAMDGYAIHSDSVIGASLIAYSLRVIGESAAGRRFTGAVAAGEAVRIFTGAPVPDDCDTVIIQENTRRDGDTITLLPDGKVGASHVRPAAGDFAAGDVLLEAGIRLDPWRLSLVAAAGMAEVVVARRPRVAILGTGDELVPPGSVPQPDQIYESGSFALKALIETWGGEAQVLSAEGDSIDGIARAVREVACDIVVTIGGASVGDYDFVKPALAKLGLVLEFETLNLRPGKPTAFGHLADGRRSLSLPGNPASSFVVAQLLLKPWIEASLGMHAVSPFVTAVLAAPAPPAGPRESYLRAALTVSPSGQLMAVPFAAQDSSLVGIFARADALLRLPAGAPETPAGALVEVIRLDRG